MPEERSWDRAWGHRAALLAEKTAQNPRGREWGHLTAAGGAGRLLASTRAGGGGHVVLGGGQRWNPAPSPPPLPKPFLEALPYSVRG